MVEKGKNDYSKKENEISKRDLINRSFIIVFPFFFLVPGWVAASLLISVKPTSTKQRWEKCNVLISRHERKLCAHHFVGFPLFDNLVTISNMQAFSWDIWIFSNKFTGETRKMLQRSTSHADPQIPHTCIEEEPRLDKWPLKSDTPHPYCH